MFSTTDTIVAVATPPGHGGIGIVRLSGADAPAIARRLIGRARPFTPRKATLARVLAAEVGRTIDQVIVTWYQGPGSYTGEDVVEIGAHGSPVVLRDIVERAMNEGARLAEPGEFTFRAYLHGRIDLVQAEAVGDLIDAVTPLQARAAVDQLEGTLTRAIGAIDAGLFELCARLEASLDFPDEGYHFIARESVSTELEAIARALDALARDGRRGRMIREGATVVIAGRPNAGKSTLFNALAGADRAIVTDVPGTTRDVLTERVDLDGLAVTLVDTAGLREAGDAIEAEGVRRAREAQEGARLVLMLVDGSAPLTDEDRSWIGASTLRRVVVISKADLPAAGWVDEAEGIPLDPVFVSVRTGAGLDALRRRIFTALTGEEPRTDTPAMSNVRHLALVDQARGSVARATMALVEGATEELVLAELGTAREALESIVGRRTPDDLLRHIFGRFCIGK
ncbi:MAG: tRNA uridine-5-carboxymethylaminomethyl(34) synthesis GTPase MnmE [Acidobacteria bacterium]|nr:tRNA uridine-5-carboxymethylaminomethyl(34) synthesis GTPase MnmE [Acidobacteriota bacterium]